MKIACLVLRGHLIRYQDGELRSPLVKRVEDHLLDCGECRARLLQLRNGQRFALELPRVSPRPNSWDNVEAAIEAEGMLPPAPGRLRSQTALKPLRIRPATAVAILAVLLVALGMLVLYSRQSRISEQGMAQKLARSLNPRDFHAVAISDIKDNIEPHVVAEGYVAEIRSDEEDGDLVFKLVDDPHNAQPFIVCEIINPINLSPPLVGSRVRVYGVSRYDAKSDHQWYELHPVLNIEPARRQESSATN
jgi:hypothetical protein